MFAHIAPAADRRYPRRCLVMHAVVSISLSCPHATSELATVAARILRRDCVLTAGRPRNDHQAAAWRLRGDREVTALAVRKKKTGLRVKTTVRRPGTANGTTLSYAHWVYR